MPSCGCWRRTDRRLSRSRLGHWTPGAQHAYRLEPVVDGEQVGPPAGLEGADLREAQHRGRGPARRRDRVGERDAHLGDAPPDHLEQRRDTAGDRAAVASRAVRSSTTTSRPPREYVPSGIPDAAIASVMRARPCGPTVSNSMRTVSAARCTPSPTTSRTASPLAAAPRAAATGPGERWCSGGMPLKTWVTSGRPPRGAELADPVERGAGGAGVGVGMPDRRHHGGRGQLPDQGVGAAGARGRRSSGPRPAAGLGQRLDEGRVGVDQRRGVLGAAAGHGEERTLEVDPGERAVVDQPRRTR